MEYNKRMMGYYPPVIATISEIKAINEALSGEIANLNTNIGYTLDNAWLPLMHEDRVKEWENKLGITPDTNATLEDRRAVIISTVLGSGKINADSISDIVAIFVEGGQANVSISGSTVTVKIQPPPGNTSYNFANVEAALRQKLPAHLNLNVTKDYVTWNEIKSDYTNWNEVKTELNNWGSMLELLPD